MRRRGTSGSSISSVNMRSRSLLRCAVALELRCALSRLDRPLQICGTTPQRRARHQRFFSMMEPLGTHLGGPALLPKQRVVVGRGEIAAELEIFTAGTAAMIERHS